MAYFDCFSGAGGDMIVGSLIDAGADASKLMVALKGLDVVGYTLAIEKTKKQGFAATRFDVRLDSAEKQPHRHLKHVVAIIEAARLDEGVKRKAIRVFERLANAEAAVHGTTIEKVHFHEVGAVDAIIDVVGAVVALDLLGVEEIACSPIPVGSGTVRCSHGIMPVPAPATAELLKGVPIAATDEAGELTTPTAAAVLTTLAGRFGAVPEMKLKQVGYGAGTRDGTTRPNVLRVLIGSPVSTLDADTDEVTVLETNLDDASPQVVAHCMDRLLAAGALDVYSVPIQMKKTRSGILLAVICETPRAAELERLIFAETPTFGVRRHTVRRTKLRRRHETVSTPFGSIRMKIGESDGQLTATPEYEDCRMAAEGHQVALRTVLDAARKAWGGRSST